MTASGEGTRGAGPAAEARPAARVEAEGRAYRAIEAWRGRAGHGLCYFLALEDTGGTPAPDDRRDRRAALQPEERFGAIGSERWTELLDASVPLTDTERRFADTDGRLWLAQNVGPVWAEGVAQGLTGVLFTSLQGTLERRRAEAGHLAEVAEEWLRRLLEGAEPAPS